VTLVMAESQLRSLLRAGPRFASRLSAHFLQEAMKIDVLSALWNDTFRNEEQISDQGNDQHTNHQRP
jgi:hypothetical protein